MNSKKWLRIFLLFSFLGIGLVGLVNYIVDPFQQYRKSTFYKIFFGGNQRFKNPGFAKNYDYNSIIIGSSMTANFLISKSSEILKNPIKFTIDGAAAHEIFLTLHTAFGTDKKIQTVLIGFDIYALSGKIDRLQNGDNSLPLYLYDLNIFNDYLYLLSFDTLVASAKAILRPIVKKDDILYNYENMYQWQHLEKNSFGKEKVLKQLKEEKVNKYATSKGYSFENLKNSFDYNFLSIVKKHPEINFIFFYPPYSILAFKQWQDNGTLEDILKFKLYAFSELSKFQNIKLYDFQTANQITTNLDNYRDFTHYHQNINSYIIDEIKNNNYLVNEKNVNEFNTNLRLHISNYILEKNEN